MTRLRSFALVDTPDSCRAGLRAYRNGRDWCKAIRDRALKQANERANAHLVEAEVAAGDPGARGSPNPSFATAPLDTPEDYTITMSQASRTSLNQDSHTHRSSLTSLRIVRERKPRIQMTISVTAGPPAKKRHSFMNIFTPSLPVTTIPSSSSTTARQTRRIQKAKL